MSTAQPPNNRPPTEDVYLERSWEAESSASSHPLPNWRLPFLLVLATALSTFIVGSTRELPSVYQDSKTPLSDFLGPWFFWDIEFRWAILAQWRDGMTYMLALLAILLAHEFGHFLAARWYRIRATWPLFLPMPFSPFGTLGAVIMMDHRLADRRQIFDIGLAGPLAGLVVAIPCMIWGISDLKLDAPASGLTVDLPLLSRWFMSWLQPQHSSAVEITMNQTSPMFMAAWVGFVVTGLNMLPVSQLDGGHVTYALFGRRSVFLGWIFMAIAIFIVTNWYADYYMWTLMIVLVLMMGIAHPPTANDSVPLGRVRTILGFLSLAIPILTFAPRMVR